MKNGNSKQPRNRFMFRSHNEACSTDTFGLSLDQVVNDLFVCVKYLARSTVSVLCVSIHAISCLFCQSKNQSGVLWELLKWWKSRKPCERLIIVGRHPCLIWRAEGRGAGAKREIGEGIQHHRGRWAAKEHSPTADRTVMKPKRWLSGQEHGLFLQRLQVRSPATTLS